MNVPFIEFVPVDLIILHLGIEAERRSDEELNVHLGAVHKSKQFKTCPPRGRGVYKRRVYLRNVRICI